MRTRNLLMLIFASSLWLGGCGGGSTAGNPSSSIEDTSTSGAAAAAIGGALTGSSGSGALASSKEIVRSQDQVATLLREITDFMPEARASSTCPTVYTAQGLGCTASGDSMWLSLGDCSYSSAATYLGVLEITSSNAVSCGTAPSPGANGSLLRQYTKITAPSTPGTLVVKSAFGTTSTIDDAVSNLGNFDGATIATIANGGYGAKVQFGPGGGRSSITIGHRLTVSIITDMSISGTATISEASGAAKRDVSGQITIYHNLLKVIATSTFQNIVHEDGCCLPTSGTISTTFARGTSSPTSDGDAAVGKTETLTLTGCGTGTLQTYDGKTQDVTLSRCF